MWLLRCQGRFQAKVAETIARGKTPNLRNFAYQYRDRKEDEEIAWRAACLFVDSRPTMQAHMTTQDVQTSFQRFIAGGLDQDLFPKARALDPSFVFEDLRYIRDQIVAKDTTATGQSEEAQEQRTAAALKAKQLADLGLFEVRLQGEGTTWSAYRAALSAHNDNSQNRLTAFREAAQEALETAVRMHTDSFYLAESFPDISMMPAFMEAAAASLLEQSATRRPDDMFRINFMNFAAGASEVGGSAKGSSRGQEWGRRVTHPERALH
jgi:hypothetical protein